MVSSILCVCTGNICRSPVAADALRAGLPGLQIVSAGLHALAGQGMDADSAAAARQFGIPLTEHVARQISAEMAARADLILAMAQDHRAEIADRWPQFSGKTLLLGHFENDKDIPDPYRMGAAMHLRAVEMIRDSARCWVRQIGAMPP